MKTCPYCAEEIQGAAIKCRYCGEMLSEPRPQGHPGPRRSSDSAMHRGDPRPIEAKGCLIALAAAAIFAAFAISLSQWESVQNAKREHAATLERIEAFEQKKTALKEAAESNLAAARAAAAEGDHGKALRLALLVKQADPKYPGLEELVEASTAAQKKQIQSAPSLPKPPASRTPRSRTNLKSSQDSPTYAFSACKRAVTQRLKSPRSAEFKSIFAGRMDDVRRDAPGKFTIRSWVDAQNGFGALIRSNFYCEVDLVEETVSVVIY